MRYSPEVGVSQTATLYELAGGDVDLAAAEIHRIEAVLHRADHLLRRVRAAQHDRVGHARHRCVRIGLAAPVAGRAMPIRRAFSRSCRKPIRMPSSISTVRLVGVPSSSTRQAAAPVGDACRHPPPSRPVRRCAGRAGRRRPRSACG